MFRYENYVWRTDTLELPGISHGFSTREGGISTLPYLEKMNCGFYRGDSDETVRKNIELLCDYSGCSRNVTGTPQIHSAEIRIVTAENAGEGIIKDVPYPCDGFVTEEKNLTLLIRVADCAPVLICGVRGDGSKIISAVHAGWRGAAGGIAPKAVDILHSMGAEKIYSAVGACIHDCCYEVGCDMKSEVEKLRGASFASRHIKERNGKLFADIAGMNRELLLSAGADKVDVCPECTACRPDLYHSHRMTGGKRGTMGAVISITE